MASDLNDQEIIVEGIQNLLLSATFTKRYGRNTPPGNFQYFGECFPDRRWFNIKIVLEQRGLLNIIPDEEKPEELTNPLQDTLTMLQDAIQLIHTHTSTNNEVDFKTIKETEAFTKFQHSVCKLQTVSLNEKYNYYLVILIFILPVINVIRIKWTRNCCCIC